MSADITLPGVFYFLPALAVFSGLSVNLILQCGFSLKEITLTDAGVPGRKKEMFAELGVIFISVILLWLFFSFTRSVFPLGLFEYILLFPVSCLLFSFLDNVTKTYILKLRDGIKNQILGGEVLTSAALFITLNITGGISGAAVTAFGFTLGIAVAFFIIGGIRRRSAMEAVPGFLKGGPLALISMGLLSLVFSSVAVVLYKFLEG